VTTDDAYVQAHSALIAPQLSGYIIVVPVDDNRGVHAGQFSGPDRSAPLSGRTRSARANVAVAQASIATLKRQIEHQRIVVTRIEDMRGVSLFERTGLIRSKQQ
jgi:membrane fusion protein (multidrug efflux system)